MPEKNEFFAAMGDKVTNVIEKKRRFYFQVADENVREVVEFLFKKMGCRLSTATATEVYKGIEVLYHFSHDKTGTYYCPRIIMTDKKNPKNCNRRGMDRTRNGGIARHRVCRASEKGAAAVEK